PPHALRNASAPDRVPIVTPARIRNWRLVVERSRGCMEPSRVAVFAQCKPTTHDVSSVGGRWKGAYGYMWRMASAGRPTLPGHDYHAPEVFELEREKIFFREWFYAGRADHAPEPGDFLTVDVVGESVLVVRGKDTKLRGFYNVCRHRGSRICDPETRGHAKGAIKCPYHAWTYSYDGKLIGTPLVGPDEVDRSSLSLW